MEHAERKLFVAALQQAASASSGGSIDPALRDLGWSDALAADRRTAVSTLFELHGEHDVTSTALDTVVAAAAGLPATRMVLPPLAAHAAPGTLAGNRIRVHGVCRGRLDGDMTVVVATSTGHRAVVVAPGQLQLRRIAGMAPAMDLVEVTGDVASRDFAADADWTGAVAAGQMALAHELVGTARTMLRLAREHALERMQFGRPIASFQAVRHRLADALVAVEAAQAAADAAWDDSSPTAALLAKAVAGRSARIVARHAQQVLAGMGFTTEHPLHRYVRRALLLDAMFGSTRTLTRDIGEQVLRRRQLPPPIPL